MLYCYLLQQTLRRLGLIMESTRKMFINHKFSIDSIKKPIHLYYRLEFFSCGANENLKQRERKKTDSFEAKVNSVRLSVILAPKIWKKRVKNWKVRRQSMKPRSSWKKTLQQQLQDEQKSKQGCYHQFRLIVLRANEDERLKLWEDLRCLRKQTSSHWEKKESLF